MKNKKLGILNIVIAILAVVFVTVLFAAISEIKYALSNYERDEFSFSYAMEDGNYGEMVEMYYGNCGSDGKEKKELLEYYGVAKYYEAAFHYKMYIDAEDSGRAARWKASMDEASLQMGDFAFLTGDINQKLGIAE